MHPDGAGDGGRDRARHRLHGGGADITLPERTEHRDGSDDVSEWVAENTHPGDLVILPIRDVKLGPLAIKIHESGRSILAVAHNPESQSAVNGSTMTLPVGGSIAPA